MKMSRNKETKWLRVIVLCFVGLFLTLPGVVPTAAELPKSVSIATHPKGSLLNVLGSGFAKIISLHTPIMATDRPFTGYITWVPLMNKGEVDMGVVTNPDLYHAFRGLAPYKEVCKNLRLISSGTGLKLSYLVRADSGIKSLADLKGKRVAIDASSMSTRAHQETVLKGAGLDLKRDVKLVPVAGVVESIDALIDGRTDAAWASVGMGKVKEAAAKVGGIYWLSVITSKDDPAAKRVIEENRKIGTGVTFIKAGTAPDFHNDAWVLNSFITLSTHKDFSGEAAYLITKAIWEHGKELAAIHPQLKGWVNSMVSEDAVIPYHPGAIRWYKEAGAWSDKMEAVQKQLLSR
jgi:TRAP transporter TAXI family solute receptor